MNKNKFSFIGIISCLIVINSNLASTNASDIPANGQLDPSSSEISIVNPLANTEEVSKAKENYVEFSKLLDALSKQDMRASFLMSSDGKVHVATRSQDGSTHYVVNGVVTWSGCAFMSCSVNVVPEKELGGVVVKPLGNENLGNSMNLPLNEQILALEKELSEIAQQITTGQVSKDISGVSNVDVLKSMVSLHASTSKQLAALQKLAMRNRGLVVLEDSGDNVSGVSGISPNSNLPLNEQILVSNKNSSGIFIFESAKWAFKKVNIVYEKKGTKYTLAGKVNSEGVLLLNNKNRVKELMGKIVTVTSSDGKNRRVIKIK